MAAEKLRSAMVKQREDHDPLNATTERCSLKETRALVAREQRPPEPATGAISGCAKGSSQSREMVHVKMLRYGMDINWTDGRSVGRGSALVAGR